MKSIMADVAAARAAIPSITAEELEEIIENDDVLVVDVRDPNEIAATGKVAGALNVSRGMLEFRADDQTPMHNEAFSRDKTIVLYCATGGRAALSGQALNEMGYDKVRLLGSIKAWLDAGGDIEDKA